MNNKFTKVLPLCVAAFLALPFVTEHAYAAPAALNNEEVSHAGKDVVVKAGDDGNGTEIKDYDNASQTPWTDKQKKEVEYVQVGEKVEKIGKYSMAGLKGLKEVDLPKALKAVGDHAFEGCDKLEKVTFQGTEKQWDEVDIGHQGNAPLENAKVEALSIGAEEIEVKTKDPVVGVDPEGKATSSVSSPKFTVEDMWEKAEGGEVKTSSARWNGELVGGEDKTLFDKFEDGVEYIHSIRLTIPQDLVDKGYKFDEAAFTGGNAKIKVDGRSVKLNPDNVAFNDEKTVATFKELVKGLFAVPASEDTTGEGKDPKPAEAKKEEAKKAQAAKKEASNSEFYKTGDASVLPLISTMLTSGLAAFASRKKKD